jgi:uncharacterized protein
MYQGEKEASASQWEFNLAAVLSKGDVYMVRMNPLAWVALVLTLIGGLNWGLVGLFNFNLVQVLFGSMPFIERLIYVVVGVSALYLAVLAAVHHGIISTTSETPHTPRVA